MRCCDNCKEKRPAVFHLELKNIEPSPFILNEITLDLCKDCQELIIKDILGHTPWTEGK